MGILSEATEIPRKTLVMFFLIDTSGSMEGEKIASLNDAMREILPDIKKISPISVIPSSSTTSVSLLQRLKAKVE